MSFETDSAKEVKYMEWFTTVTAPSYQYFSASNQYSSFDGILLAVGKLYVIEVKVRESYTLGNIQSYGGQILELKKIKGILSQVRNTVLSKFDILYFIFFSDCLAVYNITNYRELVWVESYYQQNNQGSEQIVKVVSYLGEPNKIYNYEKIN